ncbi:MAG: hypothetical protein J5736_00950, partial [Bacilli bacterium]|nr:hypothetical protein [Bacilli bacterium]
MKPRVLFILQKGESQKKKNLQIGCNSFRGFALEYSRAKKAFPLSYCSLLPRGPFFVRARGESENEAGFPFL